MLLSLLLATLIVPNDSESASFLQINANSDGISVPAKWSPDENIAWKQDLQGYGQSSPVIWGGKVFVTSVEGDMKEKLLVSCLDLKSGNEIWTQSLESSDQVESNEYVSRAAPTPVVDDDRIVAFFESGDIVAMTHEGELLWQRSLSEDYGKFQNRFCLGASLAQDEESVFVLADHDGPSYVAALSKKSGKTVWKTDRESRISWSSPIIDTVDGQPMLIVSSQGSVDGYDPENGELLWSVGDLGGNTAPSPFPAGDGRFLIGSSPGRRGENAEASRRTNLCLQVKRDGDKWSTEVLWIAEKATSSFGSPVAYGDVAYWVNRTGVVYAFDLTTGESLFTERLDESCWATPIGIGERVYFFGRTGDTTVLSAGKAFQQVGTNRLWPAEPGADRPGNFGAPTQYGIAAAGDRLLIRTGKILYCVQNSSN